MLILLGWQMKAIAAYRAAVEEELTDAFGLAIEGGYSEEGFDAIQFEITLNETGQRMIISCERSEQICVASEDHAPKMWSKG